MKKLFIASAMLLMTGGVFANDIAEEKLVAKSALKGVDVCCRRGLSDPETGQNVSITACTPSTGDYTVDKGKACEKATKAAKTALEVLLR